MMNNRRRVLMFLYSTPNMIGAAMGSAGLGLYFTGIIHAFWLPIVAGMYAIGYIATPKNPKHELRLRNQFKQVDIRNELESTLNRMKRRLPKEAYDKVLSIRSTILTILPQIEDLSSSDYNIYLIQQTATDYLPSALESYVSLPRAYANYQPIKDGKTARQLLLEQLDLLDREVKAVVQDIYKDDTQQLIVHGQFLKDKFGDPQAVFQPAPEQKPLGPGNRQP
jgi:hypothetical protein